MKTLLRLLIGIISVIGVESALASSSASDPSSAMSPSVAGLGQIHFPTSTQSEKAQQWFLRGVLLLHSFQYDDAKEAFQQAQTIDANFAMAYWGEAMTENHPLWQEQYKRQAREILNKLGPTSEARLAKAPTQREKGYIQAVELLFGEGTKLERDLAYLKAMKRLSEEFPDDQEAAAFHALALLGSRQGKRDFRTYMKAAAIGEAIFQKNPHHPGAVHYLIHSYDDPIHAPLGLRAANVYGDLAPAASHAQHMPSHIFMSLGMWEQVIQANETSWASSEARIKEKGLTHEDRPYHTLHWLEYGYLQEGRDLKAKALLNIMAKDAETTPTPYTRGYLAAMNATFIIETRQWDVGRMGADRSGIRFTSAASELFSIGMSGINTQQIKIAQQALIELQSLVESQSSSPSSNDRQAGQVLSTALEGLLFLKQNNTPKGLQLIQEATKMEDLLPYTYGPPFPIKPAHELAGEVFLELNQNDKAKREFELALDRAPQRALALEGLARSIN